MAKNPTSRGVSALLCKAGFARWLDGARDGGFRVRGDASRVYVNWQPRVPLPTRSAEQAERNKLTAQEMAGKYAEAIRAAGWKAEVIYLAGPVVCVTPKEG